MFRKLFFLLVLIILSVYSLQCKGEENKEEVVVKEIMGEVSYVDAQFIAVTYKKEKDAEYDIMLYIDKDVILENIKDFYELGEHDIVRIEYAEVQKGERVRRIAKTISLVESRVPSLDLKGLK
jgi:hypothetical protein